MDDELELEHLPILTEAEVLLKGVGHEPHYMEDSRMDISVRPTRLVEAVTRLINARWGYLSAITGLDHGPRPMDDTSGEAFFEANPYLELLYHFVSGAAVLTLRLHIPYDDTRVPSICGVIPSATLYEREARELFGINIQNTPNTDLLVLPENWPAGVYPLRKSFTGLPKPVEEKSEEEDESE
jgi:Ni,Fe-hydrogenase III component G